MKEMQESICLIFETRKQEALWEKATMKQKHDMCLICGVWCLEFCHTNISYPSKLKLFSWCRCHPKYVEIREHSISDQFMRPKSVELRNRRFANVSWPLDEPPTHSYAIFSFCLSSYSWKWFLKLACFRLFVRAFASFQFSYIFIQTLMSHDFRKLSGYISAYYVLHKKQLWFPQTIWLYFRRLCSP